MPDYSMLCAAASGDDYIRNVMAMKFNGLNASAEAQSASAAPAPKGPEKDFGL